MMYVIGIMALITALSGLWGTWEHKSKVAAEAQVSELTTKIESQNQAIEATKAEGDRRVAEALKGVQNAAKATQAARSEAQRLKAMVGQPTPAGNCPSASAVAEVRKGLLQ